MTSGSTPFRGVDGRRIREDDEGHGRAGLSYHEPRTRDPHRVAGVAMRCGMCSRPMVSDDAIAYCADSWCQQVGLKFPQHAGDA